MAKTLKEIPTRSASAETKPIGVAMTLDDLDVDVRSQTVAQSLERVLTTPMARDPSQVAASAIATPQTATPAPTRALEPIAPEPQKTSEEKKKPASQMLSTPIPAALKRRLNGLRLEHSISTAFVVEVALNEFFGARTDEAIAADLQARGGRLRRNAG